MASKDEERFWLEQALQVFPELAGGDPIESEAPDFVFLTESRRIGVEVTRFAHPRRGVRAPEAELGTRKKLLRLARRAYEERAGPPLSVVALFSYGHPLRGSSLPALSRQIADHLFVQTVGREPWSRYQWTHDDAPPPPNEIDRLTAHVLPTAKGVRWYPARIGWVWNADLSAIQEQIARKEAKAPAYRQRCDELVLLVVFDGTPHQARVVHAPTSRFEEAVATSFDRVVCFDLYERRVVPLKTTSVGT